MHVFTCVGLLKHMQRFGLMSLFSLGLYIRIIRLLLMSSRQRVVGGLNLRTGGMKKDIGNL